MDNLYSAKDLASFGKYVLSKERTDSITSNHQHDDSITLQERLLCIYDADIANWRHQNEGSIESGGSTAKRQALSEKLNQINDPELTQLVQDVQLELMRESEKAALA